MVAHSVFAGVAAVGLAGVVLVTLRDLLVNTVGPHRFDHGGSDGGDLTRRGMFKVLRWLAAPITTAAAAWILAFDTSQLLRRIPSLLSFYGASIHKVLPLHPRTLQEAFDLGVAYKAFLGGTAESLKEAARIASAIAGRPVDAAEIAALPQRLHELMSERGVVSRVLSVFSLVNIAWFIAILGLTCTAGPFLMVVTKPLWLMLLEVWRWLCVYLVRVAKWAVPLYEPLAYLASLLVLVESSRYAEAKDAYGMTGTMIGFTSIAMFGLSWVYTTVRNSQGGGDFETYMTMSWVVGALYCIPIAKIHQSTFVGYVAVGSIAAALRFSIFSSGLTTFLGFSSHKDLVRATLGCGAMAIGSAVLKASGVGSEWIVPFQSAASVLGSSIYLLGLDILSYLDGSKRSHAFYIANLVAFVAAGELLNMPGLSNVAKTYTGLLLLTLYCEARPKGTDSFIVWLFMLFAAIYAGSLFFSRHPELVAAALSGGLA